MSDTSLALTRSLVATQSAATAQALQIEMLRQQAGSEQAIVAMLDQGGAQAQAILPEGQGKLVDISA